MDAVDISKEVFALADFYSGINYSNPLRDPRVHAVCRMAASFFKPARGSTTLSLASRLRRRLLGSVNLYTQEFFSLMSSRLKEGGIATFWLRWSIESGRIQGNSPRVPQCLPERVRVGECRSEWIMMGIKGSGRKVEEEEIRQLWSNSNSGADLRRIGIEVPQQMAALFVMDGAEIDLITRDIAPLTDLIRSG